MVSVFNSPDRGLVIKDDNKFYKFDRFGKLVTKEHQLLRQELNNHVQYQCVSVLNANGSVEVAFFGKEGKETIESKFMASMNILNLGGYVRRLSYASEEGGIGYTQTLYLYPVDYDLEVVKNVCRN